MTKSLTTAAIAVLVLCATNALAADPAPTCEASKLGTTAKYASCRLKADAKAVKTEDPVDYSKCNLDKFASAETKAGPGVCPTEGDQTMLQGVLDQCTSRSATLLRVGRFTDNGDGTVTDNKTGLMWEKKTTAVGSGIDLSNPHDVDNVYTWTDGTTAPTGTTFTDFLDKLNGQAGVGTGFAGHYDWRLPTSQELEGIVDLTAPGCGSDPCIDPVFGPTHTDYWSSSTYQPSPSFAWYVFFSTGNTIYGGKTASFYVRAVRADS